MCSTGAVSSRGGMGRSRRCGGSISHFLPGTPALPGHALLKKGRCLFCCEQDDAGLLGACPADGEAGGHEGVAAKGVGVQGAMVSGGVRGEFGESVAGGGVESAQGTTGVLSGVGTLGGVGEQEGSLAVGVEQGAVM